MAEAITMNGVTKRQSNKKKAAEKKVVIYLEVPESLKERMEQAALQHNRKLTGECITAFQEYLAGLDLPPPD